MVWRFYNEWEQSIAYKFSRTSPSISATGRLLKLVVKQFDNCSNLVATEERNYCGGCQFNS